ncbi:MAG TPA: hypothetical protein VLL27_08735 [Solirubrobacterales bacterium]|nr:hypothetical protein [Solirubrobacterales bacterium]
MSQLKVALLFSIVALTLVWGGCGSGSGATSPTGTGVSTSGATPDDSGGGARQFESKSGDNSIQEYGEEASSSELDEAAVALHGYLDARAARSWAEACEDLSPVVVSQLGQLASGHSGEEPSCAKFLATLSVGISADALRQATVADVGAFRVEGESGFLLFHGAQGADYFTPMVRDGGAWKVAAIAPSALG